MTKIFDLRDELARQVDRAITVEGDSLTLGLADSTGRQIPLVIGTSLAENLYRVGDGGESWGELVQAGHADPSPSDADTRKIAHLCELYQVAWDSYSCEVHCMASSESLFDVARRVTAASIALEGWRAWFPPLNRAPKESSSVIARHLRSIGPHHGWQVAVGALVHGARHNWAVSADLTRAGKQVAVTVSSETSPGHLIERLLGWQYDTSRPLVAVVNEGIEKTLRDASELENVKLVPRGLRKTAEAVLKSAASI
jgi:hypothetical protein